MIKHLLKLVWHRKRVNFLITVEIFISFLVLFAVSLFGVYYADNYRQPLGFDYANVWNVSYSIGRPAGEESTDAPPAVTTKQLFQAVQEFDEIVSVAAATTAPYSFSRSGSVFEVNGREILYEYNHVTDSFKETLGLELVAGRWFGPEEDGVSWEPVVINQRLARELFGGEDPVGKRVPAPIHENRDLRVIGVVTDFRKEGEYAGLYNYAFHRHDINRGGGWPPHNLLVKVRPGTTAAFEEKLVARLQAAARDSSFEVEPLAGMREVNHLTYLTPAIAAGVVAGFLMLMVALGLMGVLWQNVTQRTKEIGLRRAKGATAGNIHTQILSELLIIASFGLAAGVAVVVQFPLLDIVGFISGKVYFLSLIVSLGVIYLLTAACGLYPSWLATKVQPAEALHYE